MLCQQSQSVLGWQKIDFVVFWSFSQNKFEGKPWAWIIDRFDVRFCMKTRGWFFSLSYTSVQMSCCIHSVVSGWRDLYLVSRGLPDWVWLLLWVTVIPHIISMICWSLCSTYATHVGVSNRKYQSTCADCIQESCVHITAEIPDLRRALPLTVSIWGASALNCDWAWHSITLLLSELGMLYYLV